MTAAPRTVEMVEEAPAVQSTGSSIQANLVWVFAGNALYLACQWLILTAVAKLGSPEMVGQLSLGFAITAPIFLLSNLRLRTVQATDAKREYAPADYLSVRVVLTVMALVAVAALCLVNSMGYQARLVVMYVALAKAFESGSDLFYGLFQQHDRTSRMTVSIMVRGISSVTAVAVVSYFRRDAISAAAALAASSAFLLLVCDIPMASGMLRKFGANGLLARWHWPTMWRLSKTAFPLGLSAMLMSLGANMPRYFIEKSLGTKDVGIFSAVWYVATAGGYVVSAMAEGASPRLGRLYSFGQGAELNRLLKLLVGVSLVIGLGAVAVNALAGKSILGLIYNRDYQTGWLLLIWLSVAATVANVASILSYSMISVRQYRDHLVALVVMTITTGIACQILLPMYGLNGAAFALILGYLAQAAWGAVAMVRAEVAR